MKTLFEDVQNVPTGGIIHASCICLYIYIHTHTACIISVVYVCMSVCMSVCMWIWGNKQHFGLIYFFLWVRDKDIYIYIYFYLLCNTLFVYFLLMGTGSKRLFDRVFVSQPMSHGHSTVANVLCIIFYYPDTKSPVEFITFHKGVLLIHCFWVKKFPMHALQLHELE